MYLVGLTGGIAAGKTSVAKRWVELGGHEIDADVLARQALEPNSAGLAKVADAFGSDVLLPDGSLNRQKLAEIVFNSTERRKELEAIVHPIVRHLAAEALAKVADDTIAIYTVPLLVEASVELPFDFVVTVEAPSDKQVERMVRNRGMSAQEATVRIASQASAAERANRADVILNSNQSLGRLLDDAEALWHDIERRAAAK
ncbi:MAG: dephospho-CoA kinase [Rhodoluna sp.]